MRSSVRLRSNSPRILPHRYAPSAELSSRSHTFVPTDATLRPLRDVLIVEPDEVSFSRILITPTDTRPLAGTVKAAGPGHYPDRYDHPEKHKRRKRFAGKRFLPNEVKVGDRVELGGGESGGYAFETFWWGDRLHLICRTEDVAAVHV